jgi:hypothetical protein
MSTSTTLFIIRKRKQNTKVNKVAQQVAKRLLESTQYGILNLSHVHFVGHSLGTHLATEITRYLESKEGYGKPTLIALEPPNQKEIAHGGKGLPLDGRDSSSTNYTNYKSLGDSNYYKNMFEYTKVYYTTQSAGNASYAASDGNLINYGNDKFNIQYENNNSLLQTAADSHGWVVKTFNQLLSYRKISTTDITTPAPSIIPGGRTIQSANIRSVGEREGSVQYLQASSGNGEDKILQGTISDDYIEGYNTEDYNRQKSIYLGGGSDIVSFNPDKDNSFVSIEDFNINNNKIKAENLNRCTYLSQSSTVLCEPKLFSTTKQSITLKRVIKFTYDKNGSLTILENGNIDAQYIKVKWEAFSRAVREGKNTDDAQKNVGGNDKIIFIK